MLIRLRGSLRGPRLLATDSLGFESHLPDSGVNGTKLTFSLSPTLRRNELQSVGTAKNFQASLMFASKEGNVSPPSLTKIHYTGAQCYKTFFLSVN